MYSTIRVTVFADIKNSTMLTAQLGHNGFRPYREDYLRIGKQFCESVGGTYHKNTGDAHMITFDELEPALQFAIRLQQYYLPQPCRNKGPLQIRIGLFLGVVELSGGDAFGSGVNQAQRVEGTANPGEVWVNRELVEAIEKIWEQGKPAKYFELRGEFELKGIPHKQTLFSFDWFSYCNDYTDYGLAPIVLKHLQTASVVLSNFTITDAARPASIIWPVVPRNVVNAIHRGQVK